jgi:signal transduction histidine kinase/CheY-like chemotaxis protein/HPt (histidine-containing phosphotransfer) domain-containing protein
MSGDDARQASLTRQATARLAASFVLFVSAVLVVGLLVFRAAMTRGDSAQVEHAAAWHASQLDREDRAWAEEVALRARELEADPAFDVGAGASAAADRRLERFLAAHADARAFEHVFVTTPEGRVLLHRGPADLVVGASLVAPSGWLFVPSTRELYRAHSAPFLARGVPVVLAALQRIDQPLLRQHVGAPAALSVLWQGEVVASSDDGGPARATWWRVVSGVAEAAERRFSWTPREAASPIVVVRQATSPLFSPLEVASAFVILALLLLGALHLSLGRWVVGTARRLADVAEAGAEFLRHDPLEPVARGRLHVAEASADEIGAVARSIEQLTDQVRQRDAERSERERVLREGEARMRQVALELEGAKARLAELLDFNRTIIAESTLGILAYKASGECVLANEAAAAIAGESVAALQSHEFRATAAWRQAQLVEAGDAALREGAPRHVEAQLQGPGGRQLSLTVDMVPFSSGGSPHLLVIVTDVTGYRAAEHALREATRLAEQANRAKTEFLANMSHEIRTPMNAIIGLTHLVLGSPLDERQRDYLRKIEQASDALLGVLNAILDYSKIEAGSLEIETLSFSLDQVLRITRDLVSTKADEKALSLTVEVAPGVPDAWLGDPLRLGQVLANLVGNAVKFTDRGGVRVSVSMPERDGDRATLRFAVADTGIGFSPEQGRRLFQAFTQADSSVSRRFGGSGLGLAISKRLVESMGGEIDCESRPGEGSVFSFTVRLTRAPDEERAASGMDAASQPVPVPTGARVLLADDNEINQMVAKVFLENSGLIVRTARTGREAVERAAEERFDVILMDVQMPEMDGLDATRAIRRHPWGREVPIIAMTAAAMNEDRQACLAAGMTDHVSKPIAPTELLAVLAKWAGTGAVRVMPAGAARAGDDGVLPASLPGFDLDAAVARLGGDRSAVAAVLWRFAQDFAEVPGQVVALVSAGDRDGAARVAHTVKGTAGTVGAVQAQAAAARLEQELRAGAPPTVQSFGEALRQAVDAIVARVPQPAAEAAAPDREAFGDVLARLARLLNDHELVPDALVRQVCAQLASRGESRVAEILRAEVKSFEYGRALETVQGIVRARPAGPGEASHG